MDVWEVQRELKNAQYHLKEALTWIEEKTQEERTTASGIKTLCNALTEILTYVTAQEGVDETE